MSAVSELAYFKLPQLHLSFKEIAAAAITAAKEGRLQFQRPEGRKLSECLYYVATDDDTRCGCAIGVGLPLEYAKAITEAIRVERAFAHNGIDNLMRLRRTFSDSPMFSADGADMERIKSLQYRHDDLVGKVGFEMSVEAATRQFIDYAEGLLKLPADAEV